MLQHQIRRPRLHVGQASRCDWKMVGAGWNRAHHLAIMMSHLVRAAVGVLEVLVLRRRQLDRPAAAAGAAAARRAPLQPVEQLQYAKGGVLTGS